MNESASETAQPAKPPTWLARNQKWIAYALALLGWAFAAYVATREGKPLPPLPPLADRDDDAAPPKADSRFAQGWVRDDEEVRAVASTLRHPVFAATPAGQVGEIPDRVYLWEVEKQAIGAAAPTRDQGDIGSCVAASSARGVDCQQCVQIVAAKKAGRPPPEFKPVSIEVIYGGSRVQVGKGRIRGDGSVGAWAADWNRGYGAVAMEKYEGYDLSAYSVSTCRRFGNSGVPASLVPEAKKHPTQTVSQVRTPAEAKRALASLYPVTVASDVGFGSRGPYVRNARGQLRPSGVWAHQMVLLGYDRDSGFLCMNSWGETWVSGPAGPGNPPAGSFWIDEATVGRMLAQDDSWAYGDQVGFPARKIDDWFLRAEPRRPANPFARESLFALAP